MLKVENITFSYKSKIGQSSVQVLENVSANFEPGKFYTIFGPSGSGKTTFLGLLGGLDEPDTGKISISNTDIKEIGYSKLRRNYVSYIFQNYYLFPYMTAVENVLMALNENNSSYKMNRSKAIEMLQTLGITSEETHRKVKRLSGGQQQRVAIARCLISGAQYILADEPTGNLDNMTAVTIIELFTELVKKYNKCVITATHSDMVKNHSDISYKLNDKKIVQIESNV